MSESSAFYRRKLYALLQRQSGGFFSDEYRNLACFGSDAAQDGPLDQWWDSAATLSGKIAQAIASSSDRVSLSTADQAAANGPREIRHPISGQPGRVESLPEALPFEAIPEAIRNEPSAKKVFWWFWRFYPERWLNPQTEAEPSGGLLYPAHAVLPDCPLHSYQATVSAVTGALFPENWTAKDSAAHPYLLIFTFSPIQDFIKASRKFLDFWAGSYLLHYLSARLCWHIAQEQGPDAVIVPSLWGQDIVDALWLQACQAEQDTFWTDEDCDRLRASFRLIDDGKTPVERFDPKRSVSVSSVRSNSLSTAGFPNVITALVAGKAEAAALGRKLADALRQEWMTIGDRVRQDIRARVSHRAADLHDNQWDDFWRDFSRALPTGEPQAPYKSDLNKWRAHTNQHGQPTYPNWEWNNLWQQQLSHAWEPYWAAVPLGDPTQAIAMPKGSDNFTDWGERQSRLSQAWLTIPSPAETNSFDEFNVGTWWGSFQQRLCLAIQAVKNTRTWAIPVAPGERSTISGQYSAVHPSFQYQVLTRGDQLVDFREGGGVPEGSMRLFWQVMARAYPGLFDGSERLNALELTKRMAWIYGDVADDLGIPVKETTKRIKTHRSSVERAQIVDFERFLYDRFVRFPNLSSIAAARFMANNPDIVRDYCSSLEDAIAAAFNAGPNSKLMRTFRRLARVRPSHIPKADDQVNPSQRKRQYLNGVMFSSKWLAEDMGLEPGNRTGEDSGVAKLRSAVDQAHKAAGFTDGSPADWWAVVLADGDGMGQYISGSKLEKYEKYLVDSVIDPKPAGLADLRSEQKRMGPATHVGLNRALLDFSNRLVPYLTEQRHCGKVIYSGGDDVMAVLPLEDLPGYLRSLRAAWSGAEDPEEEFVSHGDGYWQLKPGFDKAGIPKRPFFTMGETATMSMGIVIAHKSVPLPTVLENLWIAEKERAKEMLGKDGLCFRVIYGGGNTLEAMMKGHLLEAWWGIAQQYREVGDKLSPILYRLADELPKRVSIDNPELFALAAQVIMERRDDEGAIAAVEAPIRAWLNAWAGWAHQAANIDGGGLGATSDDLGYLLRFTAFWVDKMVQRQGWLPPNSPSQPSRETQLTGMGR